MSELSVGGVFVRTVTDGDSPPRNFISGYRGKIAIVGGGTIVDEDGYTHSIANIRLIGSPIRTVTRREIVPGTYGDVTIEAIPFAGREVTYKRLANAASLREAARTFNEIADALDEQKESV